MRQLSAIASLVMSAALVLLLYAVVIAKMCFPPAKQSKTPSVTARCFSLAQILPAVAAVAVSASILPLQDSPILIAAEALLLLLHLGLATLAIVNVFFPLFRNLAASISAGAFLSSLILHVLPFAYRHSPPLDLPRQLSIAQTSTSCVVLILLLIAPRTYANNQANEKAAPHQTCSLLSLLIFSYLDRQMIHFYWDSRSPILQFHDKALSAQQKQESFAHSVPLLPQKLHSAGIYDSKSTSDVISGWAVIRREVDTIFSVILISLVWIVAIFISPLSMNLLLNHIQNNQASQLSPYLFVVGLFFGPVGSSVALQQATFALAKLGIRLRITLAQSVLSKVIRMSALGGAESSSKEGESAAHQQSTGRANNLVGTDVDVITNSLPLVLQLMAIPVKIIVSQIYLYILLGWSAFVTLAVIVAFMPVSAWVSSRYGGVQGDIMKASDRRISLASEIFQAIRVVKMIAWEKPMSRKIMDARKQEIQAIVKRAQIYAGMMFLSTGIPAFVTLITFFSYTYLQKQTLTPSVAFTSLSLFGLLREAVISTTYLSSAFMRMRVSFKRITGFLEEGEELKCDAVERKGKSIDFKHCVFKWQKYTTSNWKLDLNLSLSPGSFTVVGGNVGSGKSAFLMACLGELHLEHGTHSIPESSTFAYAAQEPWLQNLSIRENIIFGSEWDEDRYDKALYEAGLSNDMDVLPHGDRTMVGERGLTLSGGQKARVSLARALYSKANIVLLDDVLSAVDSGTTSHIFHHCFDEGTLLRNRTVILATNATKLCATARRCTKVIIMEDGRVKEEGPPKQVFPKAQASQLRAELKYAPKKSENWGEKAAASQPDEVADLGALSWQVYLAYFASMGGIIYWIIYGIINLAAHLLMLAQSYWIGQWANHAHERLNYYFGIYAAIQVSGAISLTAMYLYLIGGSVRASKTMHQRLLEALFAAPFRWFDKTPIGRVINRLSKDTETVDTDLVESLQPVLDYGAQVLLVAISISIVLPLFLIPAALLAVGFFFVGQLYIRSALAARKQVAVTRSPLYSTLGDTTSGIVTIRAYQRQHDFFRAFQVQTDRYNRNQLYEAQLDRWLEERCDALGAIVAFIVGMLALSGRVSAGVTGFLVSVGLEFTSRILYVVRAINTNELNFNSASRIFDYCDIPSEPMRLFNSQPPASWPTQGEISVTDLSIRYNKGGPDVLRELNFEISANQSVAVVGKTGCGKSSLALALLRTLIRSNGKIHIDGQDIDELSLRDLRSRITLIPQDPVLFSGSIRENLDPEGECEDADLWSALKASGFVSESDKRSQSSYSLDTQLSAGGKNLSLGQRQQLALCRALARRSKIIIMDEATASVDPDTDAKIQKVIRNDFANSTVITIAHRLETILDYDQVLVLHEGQLVEKGSPRHLIKKPKSRFRAMCENTGDYDGLIRRLEGSPAKK